MDSIDLHDPHWFPVDLSVRERRYAFLRLDESVVEASSFLDTRIGAPLSHAVPCPVEAADDLPVSPRVGWLLHTSYCGSTLLARVLHTPPYNTCLREPLVLRRLGDARHESQQIDRVTGPTIALLSRPWHAGGSVVIKPTHAALNAATQMMSAAPGSRALLLTSSLDDFLVSNLKKSAESQAKIPQLAERAVQASRFDLLLPATAFDPPDMLCAAVIQWAAQRELARQIAAEVGSERFRVADMSMLLSDLQATALAAARWLQLDIPETELRSRCMLEGGRNAKATDAAYSAAQRAEDARFLERRFGAAIARAKEWAERHILPHMHPQAIDAASTWTMT
ncbi:hypothetical protein ACFPN1_06775 [Lysobacter yangpyeongensis]|uniref:Sulfotransferase family protein n=1 Tax=Lysobacter yangpyeongensis TaxID=346182 RepID=A0ABW0SKZ4_9GAMM